MKFKYPLFIVLVILASSCTITKRKYLPGYSVEVVGKTPKTATHKESSTERIVTARNILKPIAVKESFITDYVATPQQEIIPFPNNQHFVEQSRNTGNILVSNNEKTALGAPKYDPERLADTTRIRLAGMVCKQAKVAQHTGMLGLTLLLFSLGLWAMVQVLINTGVAWATPMLGVAVVSTGVAVGGILALLAIIFAIVAFHKIHQERGKHTGTNKGVSAIVFAILTLAVIGYLGIVVYGK